MTFYQFGHDIIEQIRPFYYNDEYKLNSDNIGCRELINQYIQNYHNREFKACYSTSEMLFHFWDEQLYTKPYDRIPLDYFVQYTDSCIFLSLSNIHINENLSDQDIQVSLKHLDLGIVVGGGLNGRRDLILQIFNRIHQDYSGKFMRCDPFNINVEPAPSLNQYNHPIPILHQPSIQRFLTHLNQFKTPVILKDVIDDWPCFSEESNWKNIDYLINAMGHFRTVPIEVGTDYTHSNWTQKLMTLHTFFKDYLTVERADSQVGYLAQYNLFDQFPHLKGDFFTPDYCYCLPSDISDSVTINGWLGPKATVSPLHTDPKHNLFCQTVGSKYICLISPAQSDMVYPFSKGTMMNNTSRVDLMNPDFDEFPNFKFVKKWEADLQPGDVLYIPPGWWHFLKSTSISFSISFWF